MSILQETMLKEGTVKVNAHKVGRYYATNSFIHDRYPDCACEPNAIHLPGNSSRQLSRSDLLASHTYMSVRYST
jgi:hypothetical protein